MTSQQPPHDAMTNVATDTQDNAIVGVTGVILAGGRSSRMGSDKAALLIGGEPLLRRMLRRLGLALAQTLVIGPPELAVIAPDARILPDAQPGLGPLGGLATALGAIATPYAFVIACDMPFAQPALIRAQARLALAGAAIADATTGAAPIAVGAPGQAASVANMAPGYDVVALRTAQGWEPLHAVYARACLPIVVAQLAAGDLAMRRLLGRLWVCELPPDAVARADPHGLSTLNANTPDEWARALALAATCA